MFDGQRILEKPFIDLQSKVYVFDEMGLLSMAFHPDYASNGRVFVFYTSYQPFQSVIAEFQRDPRHPFETLPEVRYWLRLNQQTISTMHRAGQLMFGPDGLLYASFGDAGLAEFDIQQKSYNGKLIRLDVDRPNPLDNPSSLLQTPLTLRGQASQDQIYASGFRNPWRFSFDPCNAELFLGDVGSSLYEEVNLIKPKRHYGWPFFEANHCSDLGIDTQKCSSNFEAPIFAYAHPNLDPLGGSAVIGGFVYRGSEPELQGYYIFADTTGRLWALLKGPQGWQHWNLATGWGGLVSFGQDGKGELYLINITNQTLYKLSLKPLALPASQILNQPTSDGIALEGIGNLIKDYRYSYGQKSQVRFWQTAEQTLELLIAGDNLIAGQSLEISINGQRLMLEPELAEQWSYRLSLQTQPGLNNISLSHKTDDPIANSQERLRLRRFELYQKP